MTVTGPCTITMQASIAACPDFCKLGSFNKPPQDLGNAVQRAYLSFGNYLRLRIVIGHSPMEPWVLPAFFLRSGSRPQVALQRIEDSSRAAKNVLCKAREHQIRDRRCQGTV